jgi:hypothetical protein
MLFYQHRSLQSAADAAAYSAAISYSYDSNTTNMQNQAKAVVASYGYTLGTGTNQPSVTASTTTVALTAGGDAPRYPSLDLAPADCNLFEHLLSDSLKLGQRHRGPQRWQQQQPVGGCILVLENTSTGNNLADAISLQGNPNITIPNCGIFSNSTDCTQGLTLNLLAETPQWAHRRAL